MHLPAPQLHLIHKHTPFGALHLPHLAVAKYTRVILQNSLIFPHTTLPDFILYCHTCQASKLIFPPHRPSPSYPPPSVPTTHTPFHTLSPPFHTNNFFLPPFRPIFAPTVFSEKVCRVHKRNCTFVGIIPARPLNDAQTGNRFIFIPYGKSGNKRMAKINVQQTAITLLKVNEQDCITPVLNPSDSRGFERKPD